MSEENVTKKCPYCGEDVNVIAKKCKHCGEILDATMRELELLKQQNNSGPVIVNNNNNNNNNNGNGYGCVTQYGPQKSKLVALLLCIFLGWLGAHRFYVGKVGSGIIYFLTWGWLGIGIFIDFISILCGSFTDNFNRPLL